MIDLTQYWGIQENIGLAEIASRSVAMFIICLIALRLSGMRPFGKGENFDKIITFLIGAILSRGVVGATPFFSSVASMLVILAIHKLLSWACINNKSFGDLVKGRKISLYHNGRFDEAALMKAKLSIEDVLEDLRISAQLNSLDKIETVYMERTGKISFVKKEKELEKEPIVLNR